MGQRARKLLATTLASWMMVSCGSPPAPRTADTGPLVIPPASPPVKPAPPPAPTRPKEVVAWIHVDDPAALLDLLDISGSSFAAEAQPILDLVDTRQAMDLAIVARGEKLKDIEVAGRIGLRDVRGVLEKAAAENVTIKDDGQRLHIKKSAESDEDDVVCDLGPSRSSETAVCGTPKGMEAVGEWLKSAPVPSGDENARPGKVSSIIRALVTSEVFASLADDDDAPASDPSDPDRAKDKAEEKKMLHDSGGLALELGREGNGLAFAVTWRFRSAESETVSDLFRVASGDKPNEAFARVWQDAQAAVFLPGGATMAKWAQKMFEEDKLTKSPKAEKPRKDAVAKLGAALEKPFVGGYGIRVDRARAALAAVRTAKDPAKATHTLEQALDAYVVYHLALELPKADAMMRSFVSAWNIEDENNPFYSSGSMFDTKAPPKKGPKKAPRWAFRAAPAKLGLPKGSFFVDETKVDWHTYLAASDPNAAKNAPKPDTESTLFVADGAGGVWAASGPDDAACAETAKKLLATTAPKNADDPIFARKGLIAAGYLSSLVGSFAMHKMSISFNASGAVPPASTLAEIEHDLSTPRQPLPFALTAEKQGAGGSAMFEIRGDKDAFKAIGEHVRESLFGVGAIFLMLAAMKGMGKP